MKREIKTRVIIAPQPVLIVATYDENGIPDAMNVAWGGQCWDNEVALNISSNHKTTENLWKQKAFTLSIATVDTLKIADYFGVVSGKKVNKIEQAGVKVSKAMVVNAPVLEAFSLTMECVVQSMTDNGDGGIRVVAKVVRTIASEPVIDVEGKVDYSKLRPIMFDSETNSYYEIGDKAGKAFHDGLALR